MATTEVVITARDETREAFRRVQGGLRDLTSAFGVTSLSLTALAGGFVAATKQQINYADSLSKTSPKVGVTVEKLSAYTYAAGLAGLSQEKLTTGLGLLNKQMQEAANNTGGPAAQAFKALGVEVTDANGRLRPTSDVLEEVSDKFATTRDGAGKTAIAMRLFGESGVHMIPMLNNLRDVAAEAERTGNTVSTEFARTAESFNDSMTRMQSAGGLFVRTVSGPMIAALADLAERFNVVIGAQEELSLKTLQIDRAQLGAEYANLAARGEQQSARAQALIREIDAIDAKIIAANKKLAELDARNKSRSGPQGDIALPPAAKAKGDEKDPVAEAILRRGAVYAAEEQRAEDFRNRQLVRSHEDLQRLTESLMTEEQVKLLHHERDIEILNTAFENRFLTEQEHKLMLEELELQHQAKLGNVVAQGALERRRFMEMNATQQTQFVLGQMLALTQGVATHSKTMFKINKAAGIANAIINTYLGVTKALSAYPPPLSIAMAAVQMAAGMAQVKAIKSASFGSATSAPSVGGGQATPVTSADNGIPSLGQPAAEPQRETNVTVSIAPGLYGAEDLRDKVLPQIFEAFEDRVGGGRFNVQVIT